MKENSEKFSIPVFFEDINIEEFKKLFNKLPGYKRHFLKRIVDHGDIDKAAVESNLTKEFGISIEEKSKKNISALLDDFGIDSTTLIGHLKQCLDAKKTRWSREGEKIEYVDLDMKLKTVELILKLKGEFTPKKEIGNDSQKALIELFKEDTVKSE